MMMIDKTRTHRQAHAQRHVETKTHRHLVVFARKVGRWTLRLRQTRWIYVRQVRNSDLIKQATLSTANGSFGWKQLRGKDCHQGRQSSNNKLVCLLVRVTIHSAVGFESNIFWIVIVDRQQIETPGVRA